MEIINNLFNFASSDNEQKEINDSEDNLTYYDKYLKYKQKYLDLKEELEGGRKGKVVLEISGVTYEDKKSVNIQITSDGNKNYVNFTTMGIGMGATSYEITSYGNVKDNYEIRYMKGGKEEILRITDAKTKDPNAKPKPSPSSSYSSPFGSSSKSLFGSSRTPRSSGSFSRHARRR